MKKLLAILLMVSVLASCSSGKTEPDEQTTEVSKEETVSTEGNESESEVAETETKDSSETKDDSVEEVITEDTTDYILRDLASEHDKLIGAAIEPFYLEEEDYAMTLKKYFNVITPENRMKWGFIHPEQDVYAFEEADKIVDFAMENNMKVRGHALMWHIENPDWLLEGEWTRDELIAILEDHIKTVVGHYKGKVYAWDVVNEAIDNNTYRETLWYKVIGPEYIEYALEFAHEADPDALLFLNDYMVEEENLKSNFYYEMVTKLLDKGAPLDGVGFQFHIDMDTPFDNKSVYSNIKRFQELGLVIDFTEIDVRMTGTPTDAKIRQQTAIFESLMDIAVSIDAIQSYTLWGFTDKYSWVPGFFTNQGYALIFDEEYNPKDSFYGLGRSLTRGPGELPYEKMLDMSNRLSAKAMVAKKATTLPVIDGVLSEGEWDDAIVYKLAYNQINSYDQRSPENVRDASGLFGLLYGDGYLYGKVLRSDDRLISSYGESYKNDNLEVFIQYKTYFNQLRTLVGKGFEKNPARESLAVWNEEGTVLEFLISMPEEDLTGLTMSFNMALSDSDDKIEGRKYQLYPFAGSNTSYMGKDLGLVWFEGDTPRPVSFDKVIPALQIRPTVIQPDLDGEDTAYEWMESSGYPFAYDLLDDKMKASPIVHDDIYGDFKIGHNETQMYGFVQRKDDITVVSDDPNVSDSIHINFNMNGYPLNIISSVGENQSYDESGIHIETIWNESGTGFEFHIDVANASTEIQENLLTSLQANTILQLNIMLIDVDEEGIIDYVLSPFNGDYSVEVQYRGEMEIK